MKVLLLFPIILFLFSQNTNAQDTAYAHQIINTLASSDFAGRGYVDKGIQKAAKYIEHQYEEIGLKSFNNSYAQPLEFPINTIQKTQGFSIDGKTFKPGSEYMISCFSKSFKGTYELVYLPDSILEDKEAKMEFYKQDFTDKFVVISANLRALSKANELSARGVIFLKKKLFWSVSSGHTPQDYVVIDMLKEGFPKDAKTITLQFKSKFYPNYKTQNTIGYIEGSQFPDSFIVFTGHYDHLGRMGKDVIFPGANDNASGIAMILNLARHYSKPENKPKYSLVFMCFTGEEAGLLGSKYYVQHPLFSLEKIRFLINLDMVGTGSKGITVINGTKFENDFMRLKKANDDQQYINQVKMRGEACNSDHCPFYSLGVPAFFIFTMGKEFTEYHNIYDRPEDIPLTAYNGVFNLMCDFINSY